MNKTHIFLFLTTLTLIFCVSCHKEPSTPDTPDRIGFTATTSDYGKPSSKTTLADFTPLWKAGDSFVIWGNDSTPYKCHTYDDSTSQAFFQYDTLPPTSFRGPYTAIYPSEIAISPTSLLVPPSQSSISGNLSNAPMYAYYDGNNNELRFENLCGVVRLRLFGESANRIYYIILFADQRINGKYNLIPDTSKGGCPQLVYSSGGSTSTILQVKNAAISEGNYYIALPPGTYNTLSAYMLTIDNTSCSVSLTQEGPITIEQGCITPFVFDNLTFVETNKAPK